MHKTESPGNSSGLHVNANPPLVAGTKVGASTMNAVQQELCNLVEAAGKTLLTQSTDTFDQVKNSFADPDDAFIALQALTNGTAEIETTAGTKRIKITATGSIVSLQLEDDSAGDVLLGTSTISLSKSDNTSTLSIGNSGITYYAQGVSEAGQITTSMKAQKILSDSDTLWDESPTEGWYSRTSNISLPGVPIDARIINMSISFNSASGPMFGPAQGQMTSYLGWAELENIKVATYLSPRVGTDVKLHIEYDPTDIF